jgi:hypothetical protein
VVGNQAVNSSSSSCSSSGFDATLAPKRRRALARGTGRAEGAAAVVGSSSVSSGRALKRCASSGTARASGLRHLRRHEVRPRGRPRRQRAPLKSAGGPSPVRST